MACTSFASGKCCHDVAAGYELCEVTEGADTSELAVMHGRVEKENVGRTTAHTP